MSQPARSEPMVLEDEPPAVLVVDDNFANLLAAEALLSPLGCTIVKVLSGDEALKQLLRRRFAVILMDVQMPGMDGFEAAAAIKAHPRTADVPIIFVTAISRESMHVFRGYALGAVDYLLKPFEPEILRAKVAVFMELYRKEEKLRVQEKQLHDHELREARRKADDRYRGLTDSLPLPMWRLRTDGTVYASNRAWSEYSGMDADRTGNLLDSGVLHADDEGPFRQRWLDQTRRQSSSFDLEARLRSAGGAYRWHLFRVVPEAPERGRPDAWVVTATDNDDQRRAREEAEAANHLKDDFLATVSHELRTPLNAIVGWARMLADGMLDQAQSVRAVQAIERNAHVQTALVNDLLDVSRIISGKLRLHVAPVRLRDVVTDSVDSVKPDADKRGVVVTVRQLDEVEVSGDRARLQQVIWNLLSNAVKFTEPGGRVDVDVVRRGSEVDVSVSDTGIGISAEFLPHVFDRFRQADSSMSRPHAGLGLGLSIVRHLVELHNGRASVSTRGANQGSVFTVTLPIPEERTPSKFPEHLWFERRVADEPHSHHRDESPSLDGLTVLLVEDQEDAREMVTEMLVQQGARVIAVDSAPAALVAVAAEHPDVLVSDIGLPGQDGYSLIRELRTLPPEKGGHIPVIAVTGYAAKEDGERALREGFQMHLAKPVERTELIALLASLGLPPRPPPD